MCSKCGIQLNMFVWKYNVWENKHKKWKKHKKTVQNYSLNTITFSSCRPKISPSNTRRVSPLFLFRLSQHRLKTGWKCSCVLCNLSLCLLSPLIPCSVFAHYRHPLTVCLSSILFLPPPADSRFLILARVTFLICTCSRSLSSQLTRFNPSICIVWCWLTANTTKHLMQFWGLRHKIGLWRQNLEFHFLSLSVPCRVKFFLSLSFSLLKRKKYFCLVCIEKEVWAWQTIYYKWSKNQPHLNHTFISSFRFPEENNILRWLLVK